MTRKILVVDDDEKTRQLLRTYLERNQYEVVLSHDGASFLAELQGLGEQVCLVVLDVMLPDTDGFALLKRIRAGSNVPVIMLTAASDETDRVVGLEIGADDYIAKPYSPRELLARIKAILRRSGADAPGAGRYFRFAGFTLDALERRVTDAAGQPVELTGLDFQLLKIFVENPGTVLDRDRLCEQTRGRDSGPLERSLDVQVSRLRLRLGDDARQPRLIKTVRGAGYVFSADVASSHG